jgi:CheY-like chemotaxis protein
MTCGYTFGQSRAWNFQQPGWFILQANILGLGKVDPVSWSMQVLATRTDGGLAGLHILVVEDEFLVALELEQLLGGRGCQVVGPAASVRRALALLGVEKVDAAVLDVNVDGARITPVAEALKAREIPFVLATGYGASTFPEPALCKAPRVTKPVIEAELLRVLRAAVTHH